MLTRSNSGGWWEKEKARAVSNLVGPWLAAARPYVESGTKNWKKTIPYGADNTKYVGVFYPIYSTY
jgi:hypothetical protein